MLAEDLIKAVVKKKYGGRAHVRGIIEDKDSWWHIHRDEELPDNHPVVVYIRT